MPPRIRPPAILTIAGSDPSGGAGVQADLRTVAALGGYGLAVITVLTAQNTLGVRGILTVPADFVARQLDTLLDDVRIDAIKIGLLGSAEVTSVIGERLRGSRLRGIPVVLDPVMIATSGDRLLAADAVAAVRALLSGVSVVTPNLAEAAVLTGLPLAGDLDGMRTQAAGLRDLGAPRVLLKGGHLPSDPRDLWVDERGEVVLHAPRVETTATHGTGCTLSTALAVHRVRADGWRTAATRAKAWLTEALLAGDVVRLGRGPGPVFHA